MRVSSLLVLASVCVIVPAENHALGETFKIASFGDSRSNKYFLGVTEDAAVSQPKVHSNIEGADWYSTMRDRLTASDFGPGVVVSLDHEILDARTDLAGQDFDLLIMNEVVPLAGSPEADAEAAAIAEFVLGGGCLVIIADNLGEELPGAAMGNKVLAAIDGGSGGAGRYGIGVSTDNGGLESASAGYFSLDPASSSSLVWGGGFNYQKDGTDQADPLASGRDDVLDNARFGVTDHVKVDPGDWSQVIGKRAITSGADPDLSSMMMEITGERIDAGLSNTGAGNVLVVGDTIFANDMVRPIASGFENLDPDDDNNNWNNAPILLNFVYQQVIPEPASLTLLVIGLAALVGGWLWRRGAA